MRSAEAKPHRRIALIKTPPQHRAKVVPLQFECAQRRLATRSADVRVGLPPLSERIEPRGVPTSKNVHLAGSFEPPQGVLAHRLQQTVASPPVLLVDLDPGRVHQTGEQAEHFPWSNSAVGTDDLSGLQTPAADEHRQPAEDDLVSWLQQPVAPVDRGPYRLLATRRRSAAADQQRDRVVQPLEDLLEAQHPHPRRGQFERQGHPRGGHRWPPPPVRCAAAR